MTEPTSDMQREHSGIVLLQSAFRRALSAATLGRLQKQERLRTLAAHEIFSTEKSYVTALKIMMGLYMNPLQISMGTTNEIFSRQEFDAVFPNVELIINLNSELLKMLQERLDNWGPFSKIGDIFLKLAAFFKMYSDYCKNYENSVLMIKSIQSKNANFAHFLKQTNSMREVNEGLDLPSFLIMPIQRLPRYSLLLDALIRHTNTEHPDWEDLTRALREIALVTSHVNEAIRTAQRMNQLLAIENRFGMTLNLIDPARRFIREGKLGKVTSRMVVRPTYFLFTDILVYGYETISGGLVHKGTIPLATTWIRDLDSPSVKFAWQIVAVNKTYTVFASSEREKQEWMKDLNDAIGMLVAVDPSLIQQRNTTITTTERAAKFFWSLFTYDTQQLDPRSEAEKQQQVQQKQQEDAARARSSSLLPVARHSTSSSAVALDEDWIDVSPPVSLPSVRSSTVKRAETQPLLSSDSSGEELHDCCPECCSIS